MMIPDIEQIKARAAAATPGPWSSIQTFSGQCYVGQANDDDAPLAYMKQGFDEQRRNAEFIAHAREDIPLLLQEIERLTAELDALRAGLDGLLAKLRDDEAAEVVRVTGRRVWPGEG